MKHKFVGKSVTMFVAILAAFALLMSACAEDIATPTDDPNEVVMARADWGSGHMQAAIYAQLIEELGYTVTNPAENTLTPYSFYPALGNGQYDLWVNGWFPIHNIYLDGQNVTGQTVDWPISPVGLQVQSGALQGYMIDKATADSMGISSMDDLADASTAAVFDSNGNGTADLLGCNEGWGCNTAIADHIKDASWGSNVEQIVGNYNDLLQGAVDKVAAGEPVLFYAWTPNWTYEVLVPGEDVVWLEAPGIADDEDASTISGLSGCTADPCNLGWEVSSVRAVANDDFLDDNPDIERLLEEVKIPLDDIAVQNALMAAGDYSEEQIEADAAKWIADNRSTVDGWLATAQG